MAQTSDLLLWLLWWCLFFTDCVRRPQPPPASHLAKAWPLHCAQVAKTTTICWCLKRLDQVDQVGKFLTEFNQCLSTVQVCITFPLATLSVCWSITLWFRWYSQLGESIFTPEVLGYVQSLSKAAKRPFVLSHSGTVYVCMFCVCACLYAKQLQMSHEKSIYERTPR